MGCEGNFLGIAKRVFRALEGGREWLAYDERCEM